MIAQVEWKYQITQLISDFGLIGSNYVVLYLQDCFAERTFVVIRFSIRPTKRLIESFAVNRFSSL